MKILCVILIGLLAPAAHAEGGGFVGNGGDGILADGQYFFRDLWDADLHRQPYIGLSIDPEQPDLPGPSSIGFAYPANLLARKVTDLNQLYSGLGDYVLSAIKAYSWTLVDESLYPINGGADLNLILRHGRLVQLARRLGWEIQIDKKVYQSLDDQNRTALLIHEALSSLVKPIQGPGLIYHQPAMIARNLTASAFDQNSYGKFSSLSVDLAQQLAIPLPMPLAKVREKPWWTLSAALPASGVALTRQTRYAEAGDASDYLEKVSGTFCRESQDISDVLGRIEVTSTFHPRPVQRIRHLYLSAPLFRQAYVSFAQVRNENVSLDFTALDLAQCLTGIGVHLTSASDQFLY